MVVDASHLQPPQVEVLKEIVDTLRPLVTSEETRSNNFNTRAAAVLSASAIVTAVSGFFAKDLYTENLKSLSERAEWVVLGGVFLALGALGIAVFYCLGVLLPKTRFAYSREHIRAWVGQAQQTPTGQEPAPIGDLPQSRAEVLARTAHELGWIVYQLRGVNSDKANRLENAYKALGVAIIATIVLAISAGVNVGLTEPSGVGATH